MHKKVNNNQAGQQSRERIIGAAVKLFARQGFAGTGLRELAAAADVNLAMINYFFGSKKELLKEILDIFLSGYLAIGREELAGDDGLQARLGRFISRAVSYFESHRDYLLVTITELPHDDPEIIEYKAAWGRRMMEIVGREVCRPLAAETGVMIPATVVGPMLTAMMASRFLFAPVVERVRPDGVEAPAAEDYAEIISGFFLKGIAGFQ
ncbi:MAG: TetR family transcriptional regulator [Desulfobacterales bacterium]|nr:TetR family transcriptional regulator [Desulfobacterales bacterium]